MFDEVSLKTTGFLHKTVEVHPNFQNKMLLPADVSVMT